MPGKQDHETLAKENLKALQFIRTKIDEFPGWATTIAFYSALQVVEAVFAHEGIHSDQHGDRNGMLKRQNRYKHIWTHYRDLWNDSLIARYMEGCGDNQPGPLFSAYMSGAKVEQTHIKHNLHQIIKSARKLIGDNNFLSDCEPE